MHEYHTFYLKKSDIRETESSDFEAYRFLIKRSEFLDSIQKRFIKVFLNLFKLARALLLNYFSQLRIQKEHICQEEQLAGCFLFYYSDHVQHLVHLSY